jgi:heme/copper-type cytochrome/quinol oxidase subunit 2
MNQTIQDNSNKLPENGRGLCWGAFFLTFIWGIFNRVWISLLIFIPIVNIVMSFVLLFKGREWAWEKGKWQSVEHFNKVQRYWSIAGFIIVGGSFILGVAATIMIPYFSTFQKKAMRSQAKILLV